MNGMMKVKYYVKAAIDASLYIKDTLPVCTAYLRNKGHCFGMDREVYKNEFRKYLRRYWKSGRNQIIYRRMAEFFSTELSLSRDNLVLDDIKRKPVLIVAVKDELERVKLFMQHYRQLGVSQFIVIDNNSTGGTREYVEQQPNTRVYLVKEPFQSQKKEAWIEKAMALSGYDRWYIVADSDELIDYVGSEQHPVEELIQRAASEGRKRLQGYLIDMYSEFPLFSIECNSKEIMSRYTLFDKDSYYEVRPSVVKGGPRGRLFGVENMLTKQSIFCFESEMLFDSHFIELPGTKRDEDENCFVIKHYKFLARDREIYKDHIRKENYFNNSQEYRTIMENIGESKQVSFLYENSVAYHCSDSLRVLPFLRWKSWD